MRTIELTSSIWLPEHISIKDILTSKPFDLPNRLTFYNFNYKEPKEWALIGQASMVITLLDDSELIKNKVLSLEEQKKYIQADANRKIVQIDKEINSLFAIENGVK